MSRVSWIGTVPESQRPSPDQAGQASAIRLALPAAALLVDESGGTVVQSRRAGTAEAVGDCGFSDKTALASRLMTFVEEWNAYAHPFNGVLYVRVST